VRVRQRRCWDRRESSQVPHAGEQKMLITLRLVFIFWMVCPFLYFMSAAANTFTVPKLHDNGAALGQISFLSGMVCVLIMGLFHGLLVPFAIGGAVLALGALILYEWSRRTVIDRNFFVGLSGEVPRAVCAEGPFRLVRHPFYVSYVLAFVAVALAFPSPIVGAACLLNIGLFVYMAFDDEKTLMASALGVEYETYRMRIGMFVPHAGRSR
jgi:protein-S-isoprenylcysteine O-methyltransferase Ste14